MWGLDRFQSQNVAAVRLIAVVGYDGFLESTLVSGYEALWDVAPVLSPLRSHPLT